MVQGRYLEVPQDIQPMFQTLAGQITTGKSTPYEKAEAITNYLRNTIQYSTTITPAPPGQDPAVWVLFDTKKGFCNYYASDEVLLLRSIGIPARIAAGFAEGEGRIATAPAAKYSPSATTMHTPGRKFISPISDGWSSNQQPAKIQSCGQQHSSQLPHPKPTKPQAAQTRQKKILRPVQAHPTSL